MPRGLNFSIEALGVDKAAHDLALITRRMLHLTPAWERVQRILEAGEEGVFKRAKGRYVRTGDTMRSLTQPHANGAIRDAHGDTLVFGTSIWYAKFLRRGKKSAVLSVTPKTRRAASVTIMEFIARGDA